jgi:NTE family protein
LNEEDLWLDYFWQEYLALPADQKPKVALVLGGGGARGLAQAGVLEVFSEEQLPVDLIVGTSVGALMGSLYAGGMPVADLVKMAQNMTWSKLVSLKFSPVGLYSTKKMEEYITRRIGDKNFYEMKIPFACVAVDIRNGEKVILRDGPVATAVRASATMPGLFEPVEYRHRLLMDGGIIDNVPVDVAKFMGADIIVAVDVSADIGLAKTNNSLLILSQVMYIRGTFLSQEQLKLADLVISPDVKDINVSELERGDECVDAGVVAARGKVREIKKLILNRVWDKLP